MSRCILHLGDITTDDVADAIVTAANEGLRGGSGVDGAVHRAAGPALLEECQTVGGCPTGEARITGAGRLAARHVIHAVGPVWHGGDRREPQLLAACHRHALELAAANGCRTVAFPAISTGVYGYPVDRAAEVAITATRAALADLPQILEVRFWLFDERTRDAFAAALAG